MKNGMLHLPLKATKPIFFKDNDDEFFALLSNFLYTKLLISFIYRFRANMIFCHFSGNCGMVPISVVEHNASQKQRKTRLKSTSKTIPVEVRPTSSMDPLGQEKEYLSTQPDHFKRQKVSLGNPSYSSERTAPGTPKSPHATTVIHDHDNLFLQSEALNFAGPTEASKVVSLGLEKIFDVVATNALWLNSIANEAKDVFKTWPSEKLKYEEELQRLTDQLKEKNELIAQLKEDKAELSAQLESSKKACENANTLLKDAQQSREDVRKKHSLS
jgi:hypothetical protein